MEKLLGMTPPMGWNSWNTFTWEINEELIKQAADAFIENGLKDAGYEYVVIDDCWSEKQRNEKGELVPDHWKFPNGIKPLRITFTQRVLSSASIRVPARIPVQVTPVALSTNFRTQKHSQSGALTT